MYVIQIFLPTEDNEGRPYDGALFRSLNSSLVQQFGGVTAFTRAPAEGHWADADGIQRDNIIVVEIMAQTYDRGWWKDLRARLEHEMRQVEIVILVQEAERV